jgi:hypothetical protein
MKKLIAKLCMWILGKLGYSTNYQKDNTQVVLIKYKVDDTELKRSIGVIEDLKKACGSYISVKNKANGLPS